VKEIRWSRVQIPSGPLNIITMGKKESAAVDEEKVIDVRKHVLVPEHIKMTEEEVDLLLEKYNISKKQLPKIVRSDPALMGLDANVGDVIKILRDSPTIGKSEYFRVVTNG